MCHLQKPTFWHQSVEQPYYLRYAHIAWPLLVMVYYVWLTSQIAQTLSTIIGVVFHLVYEHDSSHMLEQLLVTPFTPNIVA